MKPLRTWLIAALLAVGPAGFAAAPAIADAAAAEPLSAFPQSPLAIRTAHGKIVHLTIWTADSPSRQEQGLMFVKDMDEHAGMLFVFPTTQRISMWMKNTYLSLDMVFVDANGRIEIIAPRTAPFSEDIIAPPLPARAVLELKGGACERLGIHAGDVLLHPAFARGPATR